MVFTMHLKSESTESPKIILSSTSPPFQSLKTRYPNTIFLQRILWAIISDCSVVGGSSIFGSLDFGRVVNIMK